MIYYFNKTILHRYELKTREILVYAIMTVLEIKKIRNFGKIVFSSRVKCLPKIIKIEQLSILGCALFTWNDPYNIFK